jgi:hypothetical protein
MTIALFVGPSFNLFPGSSKTSPLAIINPEDNDVTFTTEVTYTTNTGGKKWLTLDRYTGTLVPHEIQTLYVTANTRSMKLGNYEADINFFTEAGHEKLADLTLELHVSQYTYGDNGPHSALVSQILNALAPVPGPKNTFSLQVNNPQENGQVTWTMGTGGVDWVSLNPSKGVLQGGGQTEVVATTDKSNMQPGTYRTDLILTITFDPNKDNREPNSVLFPVKLTVPTKIVPTLSSDQNTGKAAPAPKGKLTYHGGHLLTAVEVFTIFWGTSWQQNAQSAVIQGVNEFFDYILNSPLIELLNEYSVGNQVIGSGKRTGTKTITASEPGQTAAAGSREIDDTEIQQAIQGWIADETIPKPNDNTLYFLYLPPGVTTILNGDRSCTNFCGYHEVINNTIFYAVEPFINCKGCKFGQIIDSLTKVSSHELCEAITDPALDGWHEDTYPNYEIGDICNEDVQQLNGYTIQSEWSNKANACRIKP